MDAATLVAALRRRGVRVTKDAGGGLLLRGAERMRTPPDLLPVFLETVRVDKPALLALVPAEGPAPEPCYSCGSRRRWRFERGPRTCPRCHPPHPELVPVEWTGPADPGGWRMGPIMACVRCGRGTACIDPRGRPRHPGCRE